MQIRCPHCQNPIEVIQEEESFEYDCPSCGSSFNLARDVETTSQLPGVAEMFGHFRLIERLGTGQFGKVWKAHDTKLDRTVAIKIPRKEKLNLTESEKFLREARAAAQLNHPNIVSVHEVGRHDDKLYIASDYIQGANLNEWISGRRLTIRESVALCVKIAKALGHAHQAGVIHRDLKPHNVMINLDGEPLLTDFGLARREAGELTMTVEGQVLGTPAYMPPEQARGEGHHADARADIYSLGVILFELLTGELPFRGETRMLIVQILQDEPPSPRRLNRYVSRDLETITLKSMHKQPSRRFQTAGELTDELNRFLAGEPITARPVGALERTGRWCRRKPLVAGLSAAALLSLLIGTVVSTYFAVKSNQRANALEAAQEKLAHNLYASRISRAEQAWTNNDIVQAEKILGQCNSDVRGWEWHHLQRLCHQEVLSVPRGYNYPFVFSPDGKHLISFSQKLGDGISIWDFQTGQEIDRIPVGSHVEFLRYSPDGARLAWAQSVGETDLTDFPEVRVVVIWDLVEKRPWKTITDHPGPIEGLAFGPDGKVIATASPDDPTGPTVRIWNVETGEEKRVIHNARPPIAFSRDGGKIIAEWIKMTGNRSIESKGLWEWDTQTGKSVRDLPYDVGRYTSIAQSSDGKVLAVSNNDSVKISTVTVLKYPSMKLIGKFQVAGNTASVAVSPNGRLVAALGSDRGTGIVVWDVDKKYLLRSIRGASRPIRFHPDNRHIAAQSEGGNIKAWNIEEADGVRTLVGEGFNRSGKIRMAVSPDGRYVATGTFTTQTIPWKHMVKPRQAVETRENPEFIALWDTTNGERFFDLVIPKELRTLEDLAFSPDGRRLAMMSSSKNGAPTDPECVVLVCDSMSGKEIFSVRRPAVQKLSHVVFSPDGTNLVISGLKTQLLDSKTGELVREISELAKKPVYSPDGRSLACLGSNGVVIWDTTNWRKRVLPGGPSDQGKYVSVAYSPDGRSLTGLTVFCAVIWDTTTWHERIVQFWRPGDPHFNLRGASLSPDGRRLASGTLMGSTLKIWDVDSGLELMTLRGHRESIDRVAFGPRGHFIASCDGREVKLWDARPLSDKEQ